MRAVDTIVIHCSATANGRGFRLEDLRRWHKELGWHDVGYHWVIEPTGDIRKGRPEEEPGAHVPGHNARSIALCIIGGVNPAGRTREEKAIGKYSRRAWVSLANCVQGLLKRYPGARIVGHRDLSPDIDKDGEVEKHEWLKTCPGFDVAAWVEGGMWPMGGHLL